MKKDWQKPVLEVLDVKMTMLGADGDYTDKAFPQDTPKKDLTFHS
jgi:hypothetical protein